jgi:FkbM family methyltransferase
MNLRRIGFAFHRCFSGNSIVASCYLGIWAWLLGLLADTNWLKRHVGNNLRGVHWPRLNLKPRRIELAPGISALLIPAAGSLGFRSLYEHRMGHEPGVPDFLASRMSRYDCVVEIGANVGVYTLLFSQCVPSDGRKRVFAYEPSRKAFVCLEEHLALNDVNNVAAFNCAIAAKPGTLSFYENTLDLMKGSVSKSIAALFPGASEQKTTVPAVSGEHVAQQLQPHDRLLLKIDVMGAEHDVLTGFRSLVLERHPDIVLGVWKQNLQSLNQLRFVLNHYRLFKIGRHGLDERTRFTDESYCNYFLEPSVRSKPGVL